MHSRIILRCKLQGTCWRRTTSLAIAYPVSTISEATRLLSPCSIRRAATDACERSIAAPPPVNMSKTYMAALFVIVLLAGGVFLVSEATGGLLPEIVATIDQPASELSPR